MEVAFDGKKLHEIIILFTMESFPAQGLYVYNSHVNRPWSNVQRLHELLTGLFCDDRVRQRSEALDCDGYRFARLEPALGSAPQAYAGRCAGGDDVAGE
jgi:hypothetical protein